MDDDCVLRAHEKSFVKQSAI